MRRVVVPLLALLVLGLYFFVWRPRSGGEAPGDGPADPARREDRRRPAGPTVPTGQVQLTVELRALEDDVEGALCTEIRFGSFRGVIRHAPLGSSSEEAAAFDLAEREATAATRAAFVAALRERLAHEADPARVRASLRHPPAPDARAAAAVFCLDALLETGIADVMFETAPAAD